MGDDAPYDPDLGPSFDPKVIRLAWTLLREVVTLGARSLEVLPVRERYLVRIRVDGQARVARTHATLAPEVGQAVIGRFKVMAGYRPEAFGIPTLGVIRTSDGRRYEVHTLPAQGGEALTVTVVTTPDAPRTLEDLGLDPADRAALEGALDADRGLIVVAGPADSGKRTLLRACLRRLGAGQRSVVAVERDPTDDLPGVLQAVPFKEIGYGRTTVIESAERACADVLAVCDPLEDPPTASALASHASSRGPALASVRATDAAQAAQRLVDLGLGPTRLSRVATLLVAVRLVSRLCPECKAAAPPPTIADLEAHGARGLDVTTWRAFTPRGCPACSGVGRRGRHVVAEVIPVADDARGSPFLAGACVREALQARRLRSLREGGLRLAHAGLVALEDAVANTPP